jgi:hypothetical protein
MWLIVYDVARCAGLICAFKVFILNKEYSKYKRTNTTNISEVKGRVEIFCLQKILPDLGETADLQGIIEGGALVLFPMHPF